MACQMPVADNSEVVLFDLLIVCHFLTCLSVDTCLLEDQICGTFVAHRTFLRVSCPLSAPLVFG